ncbi:MAG: hypothetical protein EOO92_04780 [Pedobacter sp.]|nr:MAG: hypothetical protein EOO92_04780 [Pedobacter sp.]
MLFGCGQAKKETADYKAVRDEVMQFHDVVMGDHGVIVQNEMKLDTLLKTLKLRKQKSPELDTVKERRDIEAMIASLVKADEAMNDWMHKFEPDVEGKSNEEAVRYFKSEKTKIAAIDSIYKQEIKQSNGYLKKSKL